MYLVFQLPKLATMTTAAIIKISPETRQEISRLLGREPRGLEEVAVCGPSGQPVVIRVASLVDDAPFPNLFWLIDADMVYRIDCDEAGGLIQQLQKQVDSDAGLREAMENDHRAYIKLRNSYMSPGTEAQLHTSNYYEVLQRRGIGGIEDFSRIRCLHTWYAAHLVVPNTVGSLLDAYWTEPGGSTSGPGHYRRTE